MNGFHKHNIQHSSPSQINMFAGAPCAWAAKYLFGRKFPGNLAMKSGILAEDAVKQILLGVRTEEEATAEAMREWNKAAAFSCTDAEEKRGDGIPGMIQNAVTELKQYGMPDFPQSLVNGHGQHKAELLCKGDGWELPVIGYLDFYFPEHGLIVDLKTTMKTPSEMSDEHIRQGAIYKADRRYDNAQVKFLYVTPKKATWFEIGDVVPVLSECKQILIRQERLLRLDAETIREMVPVVAGSYYWNGAESERKELYGI